MFGNRGYFLPISAYGTLIYMKRLFRSRTNRVIFGVFGGLGDYFKVDPVILRLGYLLLTIFTGIAPGIFVYLVAGLIVPNAPLPGEPIHVAPDEVHTKDKEEKTNDAPINQNGSH